MVVGVVVDLLVVVVLVVSTVEVRVGVVEVTEVEVGPKGGKQPNATCKKNVRSIFIYFNDFKEIKGPQHYKFLSIDPKQREREDNL